VLPMLRDEHAMVLDARQAAEGSRGTYGADEKTVGATAWASLASQVKVFVDWYSHETNVERSTAKLSDATMDGQVRSIHYFLGFCFTWHEQEASLECFLNGGLIQLYASFLRARPCTASTIVKVLGQVSPLCRKQHLKIQRAQVSPRRPLVRLCCSPKAVFSRRPLDAPKYVSTRVWTALRHHALMTLVRGVLLCMQLSNVHRFLRSDTGRAVLKEPLQEAEVAALSRMSEQLQHLKKQFGGIASASKQPMATPTQLTANGRWADGGMAALTTAARARAARLGGMVPTVQSMRAKSAPQLALARKLSGAFLTMLQTALPPQRPRSLYTLRLSGVLGVDDPSPVCSVCPRASCRGNTMRREGRRKYRYILSHHKCERSKPIPDQEISDSTHADSVLLDTLEHVRRHLPPPPARTQMVFHVSAE
jgi:hypothetical protein